MSPEQTNQSSDLKDKPSKATKSLNLKTTLSHFSSHIRLVVGTVKENRWVVKVRARLPQWNFITVHYAYFFGVCGVASLVFWGCSNPKGSIEYTDALFLVVSAMTEAGLNTVNLSQMTTAQQVILWFLIVMGSSIFVSVGTVFTRKRAFEQRFESIVRRQKELRKQNRSQSRSRSRGRARGSAMDMPVLERLRSTRGEDELPEKENAGTHEPTGEQSKDRRKDTPETGTNVDGAEETAETSRALSQENEYHDEVVVPRNRRGSDSDHISVMQFASSTNTKEPHRVLNFVGVGARPNTTAYQRPYTSGLTHRGKPDDLDHSQYPHYLTRHTTGRNAQFYGLSRAERDHLGGVEYRAISLLAWVVPCYFVLWQLLGCLGLGAYMANNKRELTEANGINPWWLGVFNGVSAFNNSGMSLLDANMIPFQSNVYPLITMGLLILAGNTAYPLFLRLILWSMLKLITLIFPSPADYSDHKATLRFVLRYPRRVYTNLFPAAPTLWLLFTVVLLNGIDWAAFELLNIGNQAVEKIPQHFRVLDGLFQALAVRSGGFYIISIPNLRIGLQMLYVIMMYISVYPVVITMRHSNVYEERSLGIYADDSSSSSDSDDDATPTDQGPKLGTLAGKLRRTLTITMEGLGATSASSKPSRTTTGTQFVRQQIRGQLAHDLWWLILAILIITCIEVSNFERDPVTYSVFNIAFEVVSGYGCVGISTGLPDQAYSFSGGWKKASKVVLCAVMLRGRHRGLPVALDRAVRLPDERGVGVREEEDRERRERRGSMRGSLRGVRGVVGVV